MTQVVGVRFKRSGRVYYFDPASAELNVGDWVVVETERGPEVGKVVISPKQVLSSEVTEPLRPVLCRASEEQLRQREEFKAKEREALEKCQEMVAKANLPMKLLSAEYNLDGTRLIFSFSAEARVDFRDLLRQLTAIFKSRIELRQVGPRDKAKLLGGYGRCGRPLCCTTYLSEFTPVSIRMAKEQDLPLNPTKISGVCGRLACCLGHEYQQYQAMKRELPPIGRRVSTPLGKASVVGYNLLKETLTVRLESEATAELSVDEIETEEDA